MSQERREKHIEECRKYEQDLREAKETEKQRIASIRLNEMQLRMDEIQASKLRRQQVKSKQKLEAESFLAKNAELLEMETVKQKEEEKKRKLQ